MLLLSKYASRYSSRNTCWDGNVPGFYADIYSAGIASGVSVGLLSWISPKFLPGLSFPEISPLILLSYPKILLKNISGIRGWIPPEIVVDIFFQLEFFPGISPMRPTEVFFFLEIPPETSDEIPPEDIAGIPARIFLIFFMTYTTP